MSAMKTAHLLTGLGLVALLAACSINVRDDDIDHDGYHRPRTATDLCRREVDRTYGSRYRIAFDLPELTTSGNIQTVVQPFTMASRKDAFEGPTSRSLRCSVADGVLTQATPG
jgi:hypothetical protein